MKTIKNGLLVGLGHSAFCLSHVQSLPASEKSQRNLLSFEIRNAKAKRFMFWNQSILTWTGWIISQINQYLFFMIQLSIVLL